MNPYYKDEWVTIYHGDCREIVPTLPKVDLVLTDPPYGINIASRGTIGSQPRECHKRNGVAARNTEFKKSHWDISTPDDSTFKMIMDHSKYQIIWGGNYFNLKPSMGWIVWDKVNEGTDFADCELAWTNMHKAIRIKRHRWNGMLQQDMKNKELRQHPTQKPVSLMTFCVNYSTESRTILDPFMGSGSTLRAGKNLNKIVTGIEREEEYCEIAAKRMSQEVFDLR